MVVKPYPSQQPVPFQTLKIQMHRKSRDIGQIEAPVLHFGYKAEVGDQHFVEGLVVFQQFVL